jgi:hypothetical protein
MIRYTVSVTWLATGGSSGAICRVTGRPDARTRSTSAGTSARPGPDVGARFPQLTHQSARICKRGSADVRNLADRYAAAFGLRTEEGVCHLGLHDHDGETVSEDIVKFPGYAQPLLSGIGAVALFCRSRGLIT